MTYITSVLKTGYDSIKKPGAKILEVRTFRVIKKGPVHIEQVPFL